MSGGKSEKEKNLLVHRKGYYRKDGTYVKPTSYYVKDRGEPGKTPKSEQWFNPDVEMNWGKDMPVNTRRRNALKAHGGDPLATARALQALANVTTDPATKKEAGKDAEHFFELHKKRTKT